MDITDFKKAEYSLKIHKKLIIQYANTSCVSMVNRGGGVEDLRFRKLSSNIMVVELLVNVCDSMGANVINSIAEFTAPYIQNEILK
jgi:hydroxymethylglutaryl-CoA reductase